MLKAISMEVMSGETFAIIGPNGAGKTTLFKVMTGEVFAEAGELEYAGQNITQMPAHARVAIGMGRTFQIARIFPDVTARENLVVAIEARRRMRRESPQPWFLVTPRAQTIEEADARLRDVGLLEKKDIEAKFLSHGDKKRLEIGIALAGEPRVLMLDEPTAGMSPSDRVETSELLGRLRASTGVTIVMTEHDMDVIYGLAHRILVMNQGEVIAIGDIDEIRANATVRDVYLGKEMYSADD
ncbi:ABC transporter ATP-binding protein [Castellaniella sp.]|uniref:ABC transporter ATP-binding protein n=1 Tax=Castellaniella sp. TaxID=1955812 RepID=UPI0035683825